MNNQTKSMDIKLRPATPDDFDFAFEVKRQAMGPHIVANWDWNEEFQLELHKTRWNEKTWFVIVSSENDIGTVSLHELEEGTLRFGEFYLLDDYRNMGIGTTLLTRILEKSDRREQRVVLEILKWNPVRSLYERHGFSVSSENDIHYLMERDPISLK